MANSVNMVNSLDHFEFCRHIGKGSYGEVTLVRHHRDHKQYVLKKINLKKASARERRSAELEAKLLSKLKHPNIVSYKESFENDGLLYIAMQYCEGGDLYNKLKEQKCVPLEERQLVEWFVQIAMAMQYMHERNILHRDLKTQNIFLTKSKIIKVGDLGIARVLDNSSDMATTLIGTPYYMSPELFSNKPYNHKSDVWALGCCVYEMMTLKHAFNARDMNSLVYKILRGKMPPMPKQYSSDLVTLVRSMLHQDPAKRPTVNRILRDPYIKKNIAIFLEETKQSRRPVGGVRSRPGSASSQRSVSSISSSVSSRSVRTPPSAADVTDSSSIDSSRSSISSARSADSARSSVDSARSHIDSSRPQVSSSRSVASASHVEVGPIGDHAQLLNKPVINHRRTPSGGARPDLEPIREGPTEGHMVVVEGKMVNDGKAEEKKVKEESDSEDTIKAKSSENVDLKEPQENVQPPQSPTRAASNAKRKKKSVLSKYSRPDSARSDASGPVPVDNPRPLPPPPKSESVGLPQRRVNSYTDDKPHSNSSKSSSTSSSSKEENILLGDETPRSLPNLSARERRRRKPAQSLDERPHSARVVLKANQNAKSTAVTQNERKRYEVQHKHRHRQPSLVNSSSSDEDTLKENDAQRHSKEKHRENKEMNNFISLLDTTLQLNKDDDNDKSDEESKVVPDETPRIPKSSSMPSVDTLCNKDRLTARIAALYEDCMKGVGYTVLKEAYEILGRIEEDEVEPKLVSLMGKDFFDQYAGKIWQLKFCEDMARIGTPSDIMT